MEDIGNSQNQELEDFQDGFEKIRELESLRGKIKYFEEYKDVLSNPDKVYMAFVEAGVMPKNYSEEDIKAFKVGVVDTYLDLERETFAAKKKLGYEL